MTGGWYIFIFKETNISVTVFFLRSSGQKLVDSSKCARSNLALHNINGMVREAGGI